MGFRGGDEIERSFADGEYIVREGDVGREMFVIRSGGAVVHRRGTGEIARLAKGDFFGEMSVLESLPRDADVVAQGATTVLVLGSGALLMRLRRDTVVRARAAPVAQRARPRHERAARTVILRAAEERMVVVSDLHLGCPASSAEKHFGSFVDEVAHAGYALCVNGDGFDLLQSSASGLATSGFPVLQKLQELALSGTSVYYVVGNHDLALEHVLFDLSFHVVPFLNLRSGDRLIRIEHGHVYEPVFTRAPWFYNLCARLGRYFLLINADSYELWTKVQQRVDERRRKADRPRPYPHHEAASDLFRRGFDAVVFGHTHRPELSEFDGGTFVNGGDWLRRRTYVTIDAGELSVQEWQPGALAR